MPASFRRGRVAAGESLDLHNNASDDVAADGDSQFENDTKPRRRAVQATACLRRTSSRTKALLGLGLIALLVGVVQIWSVWQSGRVGSTRASDGSALDADYGYYDYYYKRSAQEGHLPAISSQKRSKADDDAKSGKQNHKKDGTKNKKIDKWLVPGAHVWLVSEKQGGTLVNRVNDNAWRVELDNGDSELVDVPLKVAQHAHEGDGVALTISNIVPFLSKRQRIMKERLKTLLQADKDAASAAKAQEKQKERTKKERKKARLANSKERTRERASLKRARQKDKEQDKRVAERKKERLRSFAKRNRTRERLAISRRAKKERERHKNNSRVVNQRKRDRKRARLIAKRRQQLEDLREMFPDEDFGDYYSDGQGGGGGSLFGGIFDSFMGLGLFEGGENGDDDDSLFGDWMTFEDYDDYYYDDDLLDALDDYDYNYYDDDDHDDDFGLLGGTASNGKAGSVDMFAKNVVDVGSKDEGRMKPGRGAGPPDQEGELHAAEEEDSYHAWLRRMKKALRAERASGATTATTAPPVNVLVLLADDFGFDAYHALENLLPDEKLPSSGVRKLAREGLQFREASTHISSPLPSRAALLTGCSAQSSGYVDARTLAPSRNHAGSSSKADSFEATPDDLVAQECRPLLQTLKELKYDTNFVGAVGGDLFGGDDADADASLDSGPSSPRKKFRASIASDNRRYFEWLSDMEPRITDDSFFSSTEPKKASDDNNNNNNNQKTGVVPHGNRITVPYAQVLEMPVDVLDAVSRSSCVPSVMDFAENRAVGKAGDSDDLPPWALFGTTSLPPSLSRAAFVANQTINILRRAMRRRSKAAAVNPATAADGGGGEAFSTTKPFGLVASFANPFTPWLVSGQTYNALIGPLEGGVEGVPLPAHMLAGTKSDDDSATGILEGDDTLFAGRSPAERSLSRRVQNFVVKNPTRARYLAALYYAKVKDVSDAVGAILKALDRFNLSENTLVVFTSTGGVALGSHGLLLRDSLFDESIHVPLIWRLPRLIARKGRSKVPVSSIDVLPTILDLVSHGRSIGRRSGSTFGTDGTSLVPLFDSGDSASAPLLRGGSGDSGSDDGDEDDQGNNDAEAEAANRATVSTDGKTAFAVRTKMRKLVWDAAQSRAPASFVSDDNNDNDDSSKPAPASSWWNGAALFDLKLDPLETRNVITDPAYAEDVQALLAILHDYWAYVEYAAPQSNSR